MTNPLIEKAIKLVGSQDKLGELCGCSQNKIWLAKDRGKIDAELALKIEQATAGEVRARDLRPDLPWPDCSPVGESASMSA